MSSYHYISSAVLDLQTIQDIIQNKLKLELSEESRVNIEKSRKYLDQKIKQSDIPIYGINTGFGSLCNVKISNNNLTQLQENLVMSHACGTGALVAKPIIRLMLLLKIQSLSYGHSGIA
ncbi:MAG TPA: aromatic amino acid lyase, partial [Gillisia sp.]|nr:aromatic amino acid lyase [Gillisia sp.]